VDRNALVSVFLRELEQYQGIMFLTTNRIGTFDDAFLSRIHVGLLYKALTDDDREKIWQTHFDRLEAEKREPAVSVHADAVAYVTGNWKKNGKIQEDLLTIQWNGREIRNGGSSNPRSMVVSLTVAVDSFPNSSCTCILCYKWYKERWRETEGHRVTRRAYPECCRNVSSVQNLCE
jgi:hypothetical protein